MTLQELRKMRAELSNQSLKTIDNASSIAKESYRLADEAHNRAEILNRVSAKEAARLIDMWDKE